MVNALSVDVEDYFQVSAFEQHIPRERWDSLPHRVEANTDRLLALFDEYGAKATFFVLGWVAQRHPGLVRRIVEAGHELASHGYSHKRICFQDRDEFQHDVAEAKKILENTGGVAVHGYRAPTYSINTKSLWAFEVLESVGYRYSSSVYPIRHDLYGMPNAPRFTFKPGKGKLIEVPITTARLLGRNIPCGGGGYFRLLPYAISRRAITHVNTHDQKPCIFYFHPWEIDPDQPRQSGLGIKTRFRHYLNLKRMEPRLRRLLKDFAWDRIDRVFLSPVPNSEELPSLDCGMEAALLSRGWR